MTTEHDTSGALTCPICGNDEVETSDNEVSTCYNAHVWMEPEESIKRIRALERQLADAREERDLIGDGLRTDQQTEQLRYLAHRRAVKFEKEADALRTENKRLQAELKAAREEAHKFTVSRILLSQHEAEVKRLQAEVERLQGVLDPVEIDPEAEEMYGPRDIWITHGASEMESAILRFIENPSEKGGFADNPDGRSAANQILDIVRDLHSRLAAAEERVKALEPLSTSKIVDEMPRQVELIVVADYCCPYFEIPEWDGDREVTMSIEQDNDRVVGWRRIDPAYEPEGEDDHE